jgi:DNA-binding MarR family transcriptional regulator
VGRKFRYLYFFSVHSLSNVARAFKRPINFDRTKAATNIYRKAEEKGLVEFKKSQGRTYVTTTEKGDELCTNFLKDFIAFARIHADSSSDDRFISKGVNPLALSREASEFYKNLVERVTELNSQFEEIGS